MQPSEDPRIVYADIIEHPRHRSSARAPMTLYNRAAQFSAYDALAGYYDMIAEEERTTDCAAELDDNARELLDQKLLRIAGEIEKGRFPQLHMTVFIPDERKEGGRYERITERVKQIDPVGKTLILERREGRSGKNAVIPLERIYSVHGEAVDGLDALT